jgi:ubiquinone/menaquinone biosynthesis C-methylase UbiE
LATERPQQLVALDASLGMLAQARQKITDPHLLFAQSDVHQLPFADNTFDVVACTWVVEITADPKAVVEEFVRVIKPDGVVVYAFCSLPEGRVGDWIKKAIDRSLLGESHGSHHLAVKDRPFHKCRHSSLKQFAGGLLTVATVAKCCPIVESFLPCRLPMENLAS